MACNTNDKIHILKESLSDAIGYQNRNQDYFAGYPLQKCKSIIKIEDNAVTADLYVRFYRSYAEYKLFKNKISSAIKYYRLSLKYCDDDKSHSNCKKYHFHFLFKLCYAYYQLSQYEQALSLSHKSLNCLSFDHLVMLFDISCIRRDFDEMKQFLKMIQKIISAKEEHRKFSQCYIKYNIAIGALQHAPQIHYKLLLEKWCKQNLKANISNPYFYLFYCHLSMLLGRTGLLIDELHITNFIVVDPYTLVQIARLSVNEFSSWLMFVRLYSYKPTYIFNTFYFGLFCLKWKHLILAKKLFSKTKRNSDNLFVEESNKLIQETEKKLKDKRCAYIHCNKTGHDHKLRVCSGCGDMYYCNANCQAKSWVIHKKICDRKWIDCTEIYKDSAWISTVNAHHCYNLIEISNSQ